MDFWSSGWYYDKVEQKLTKHDTSIVDTMMSVMKALSVSMPAGLKAYTPTSGKIKWFTVNGFKVAGIFNALTNSKFD